MIKKTGLKVLWITCFFLLGSMIIAENSQAQQVEGIVTGNSSGDALPGVNISVKGTTIGTSSNAEGHFSLNVPSLSDTLMFSFIGFDTAEVPINGRSEINVTLQSSTIAGAEMVGVELGTKRKNKRDVTGCYFKYKWCGDRKNTSS